MYTLEINGVYHDSAACLVMDGQVIAAAEQERCTRIKHGKRPIPFATYELPYHAIDYCLREAGINLGDVQHVAYSYDPYLLLGKHRDDATITLPLEPGAHPTPAEWEATYKRDAAGFVTANCFFCKEVLDVVGGFDERFTMAWREDTDLIFALTEHKVDFVHAPEAIVVHPIRSAQWCISLRQQRKSMFNALLYKKHPDLYRRYIPLVPWHYYRITAALVATIVTLLRGQRTLTLIGASAWAWMTGRFCARRLRGTSRAVKHIAEMVVTSAMIPPVAIFWRLRGALKFRVVFL